jgi:hypothetical protein
MTKQKAIKIDNVKWKPIRCKGNHNPYLGSTAKETTCEGTVIGFMAGEVLLLHPYTTLGADITGSPYINGTASYPKQEIKLGTGGQTYSLQVTVIGGKSLTICCRKCGNGRKLVGIKEFGYAQKSMLDSIHFK